MQRIHIWYMRACRLGLIGLWAWYEPDIFGAKGIGITDIMIDFKDLQNMFYLRELFTGKVRLWCM
jgi:hypothetical protein